MDSRIAIGSALKYYHKRFFVSLVYLVYFLCSCFIFFALGFSAYATTYYVDYTTGADTNNGTSTSAPWQHCPGDTRATNNANITLSAGGIVVMKGGVTYSGNAGSPPTLSANASGSAGNVIEYRSGHLHSPTWGTGRAIIDGTNFYHTYNTSDKTNGILNLKNYSYIKVYGLEIKNISGSSPAEGLIGWMGSSGGNITIDNVYLHNATNLGNGVMVQGNWNAGGKGTGFTITNSTIQTIDQHGIWTRVGVDNVTIQGNSISDVGTATSGGDCVFIGGAEDTQDYSIPTNYIVRSNDLSNTSTKSFVILGKISQITIDKNYMHGNSKVSAIDIAGGVDNLIIRNNVIHTSPTNYGGLLRFYPDGGFSTVRNSIKIYNNTLVGTNSAYGTIAFHKGGSTVTPMFTNVDIRDNIVDTDSKLDYVVYVGTGYDGSNPVVQLSSLRCDYNAYNYGTNSTPFYAWTHGYVSFANWKTYISGDSNSQTGTIIFGNKAGDDFYLDGLDTLARDKGTTLTNFSDDKNGVSRPQGTAWDIGAYEFVQDQPIAPPQRLRILP